MPNAAAHQTTIAAHRSFARLAAAMTLASGCGAPELYTGSIIVHDDPSCRREASVHVTRVELGDAVATIRIEGAEHLGFEGDCSLPIEPDPYFGKTLEGESCPPVIENGVRRVVTLERATLSASDDGRLVFQAKADTATTYADGSSGWCLFWMEGTLARADR